MRPYRSAMFIHDRFYIVYRMSHYGLLSSLYLLNHYEDYADAVNWLKYNCRGVLGIWGDGNKVAGKWKKKLAIFFLSNSLPWESYMRERDINITNLAWFLAQYFMSEWQKLPHYKSTASLFGKGKNRNFYCNTSFLLWPQEEILFFSRYRQCSRQKGMNRWL